MAPRYSVRYAVLHNYSSTDFGPWEKGSTIILDEESAEWVNRDSPGTLAEIDDSVKLVKGQPVPASALKGAAPAKKVAPKKPPEVPGQGAPGAKPGRRK